MTLQALLDIALRHETAMAVALRAACLTKAYETGEHVVLGCHIGGRSRGVTTILVAIDEETDWKAMVEGNSDTRLQHC